MRIAVAIPVGTIYDTKCLDTLRRLSDEVFLVPGVARNQVKSLRTPTTCWVGVTGDGPEGGPVIPEGYDGSARSLEMLRAHVAHSGEIGQPVALDARSNVVFVPLLANETEGCVLDYAALSGRLEALRLKCEAEGVRGLSRMPS